MAADKYLKRLKIPQKQKFLPQQVENGATGIWKSKNIIVVYIIEAAEQELRIRVASKWTKWT